MARTPRTWTGARTPSGLKRVRSAARRHEVLGPRRTVAKTLIKNAISIATAPNGTDPQVALVEALSALDRAAKSGAIHKNAAARRKSRLTIKINALIGGTAASSSATAKTVSKSAAQKAAKARIAAGKAGKAKGAQTAAGKARAALTKTSRTETAAESKAAAPKAAAVKAPAKGATKAKPAAKSASKTASKTAPKASAKTATKAAPKKAPAKKS